MKATFERFKIDSHVEQSEVSHECDGLRRIFPRPLGRGGILHRKKKNLAPQRLSALVPSKNTAFTLAEVLITLAIIGVVAALTIPTLVANYNSREWNTSSEVFVRKLEEALRVMNTQQTLAGHKTTESFVKELSKHIKIINTCNKDNLMGCFEETVFYGVDNDGEQTEVDMTKVKTAKNFGQNDWNTDIMGVQFVNGVSGLVAYNPECKQDPYNNQITGTDCLAILYDTNSKSKPNTRGKDLRGINIASLGSACAFKTSGGTCWSEPFKANIAHVWNACDTEGNTTDPDDLVFMSKYGISKCLNSNHGKNDYWAGALQKCKDQGMSLSNLTQLAELASELYGTSISSSSTISGLTYNTELGSSYGLPSPSFYFWASEEIDMDGARGRMFYSNKASWNSAYRTHSGSWGICVE